MYKSLKITNFRCITKLEVDDLARVNLVVGKNNCGKTTFLEAVFLLIGATNPQLPININRLIRIRINFCAPVKIGQRQVEESDILWEKPKGLSDEC